MKKTVLSSIIDFILGEKYYANIINTLGTTRTEISSYIFKSRQEADKHRMEIENTRSYIYVETITFRSRKNY